jgi:hypothetical protein
MLIIRGSCYLKTEIHPYYSANIFLGSLKHELHPNKRKQAIIDSFSHYLINPNNSQNSISCY